MGETNGTAPVAESAGKWIAKVAAAVVLGEAAWNFVVSFTNNVIMPALARVMGGDPQSPLYLGKGDFNVPAIFSSILQLCLGGIVAALLYQWARSAPRVRVKTVKVVPVVEKGGMLSILPTAATAAPAAAPPIVSQPVPPKPTPAPQAGPVATPPITAAAPPAPVVTAQQKPAAPQPVPPPKPQKPKKPAEVYYNIVGEPINPTEDD